MENQETPVRLKLEIPFRIYTSYFANLKTLEKAGIKCVGICALPPAWFDGPNYASVAPSKDILFEMKKDHNETRYRERYFNEILCAYRFHPEYLIQGLASISGPEHADIALCCFEKPGDFCHRHLLAEWIKERTGIEITEYPVYPKEIKAEPLF